MASANVAIKETKTLADGLFDTTSGGVNSAKHQSDCGHGVDVPVLKR